MVNNPFFGMGMPQSVTEAPQLEPLIRKLEDLPDGSSVYEIAEAQESGPIDEPQDENFYRNLAEDLDDNILNGLAADLLEEIEEDKASRSEWEKTLSVAMKYLGYKLEEFKSVPFMYACSAFDTTMSSAVTSAWATSRAELFPSDGPAKELILGDETDEKQQKADKNKKLMNHYLTQIDKGYYPDSDILILFLTFSGNAFRKVYQDPLENFPKARFIQPQDIIIDCNCTDLLESSRITHKMRLTKQEILLKQQYGEFLDIPLRDISEDSDDFGSSGKTLESTIKRIEGIDTDQSENKYLFTYYESHTTRVIRGLKEKGMDRDGFPFPYKVTIDVQNRKVVSIIRNWKEGDEKFKRDECFIHYKYLPGFGMMGAGIMNLMGSNAITLTSILRQCIDAGMFANFPGGVKMKGFKMENNDKLVGPGEFHDVETGTAARIQDAIMTFPYKGADQTLVYMWEKLIEKTSQNSSAAETKMSETHANAAMGTVLALLEKETVVQSSVMRCMHASLSRELQLIHSIFRRSMKESYSFAIPGEDIEFTLQDFDDNIMIVPVSEADLDTGMQKMLKSYMQLQLAQANPELHDMREVYYRIYSAAGIKDIDKILPKPEEAIPLDPITENMNMMKGTPVKAALWQDHPAHIMAHSNSPAAQTIQGQAHISEHMAMDYLLQIQQMMGIQLPSLEELQDPQIQNQIAMAAAQASQQMKQQQQGKQPPTPEEVMAADIQQRERAAELKHEEVKMKTEADSAKAGLQFQAEMEKIKAQLEMAQEKNETDLIINEGKQEAAALSNLIKKGKENG